MPALAQAREVALHARPSCAIRMVSCRAQKQRALVSRRVCAKAAGRASDLHVLGVAHQPPAKRHEVGLLHVLNLLVLCHTFCVVENSTQGEENADYQEMRRGNACLSEEIAPRPANLLALDLRIGIW